MAQPNGGLDFGLAFDGNGELFITTGTELLFHDPLAGDSDIVGPFGSSITVLQIAFNPADGELYGAEVVAGVPTGQLVQVSLDTGAATRLGVPGADPIQSLTFTRDGALYAALQGPTVGGCGSATSDCLVELDPADGSVIQEIGPIGFSPYPWYGHPAGRYLHCLQPGCERSE